MGMLDRDWYKEHHQQQQRQTQRQNRPTSFRPNVVIRSKFAPGFVLGLFLGSLAVTTYFVFMPDAFRALYIRFWAFFG
jgi:hypothetical protein